MIHILANRPCLAQPQVSPTYPFVIYGILTRTPTCTNSAIILTPANGCHIGEFLVAGVHTNLFSLFLSFRGHAPQRFPTTRARPPIRDCRARFAKPGMPSPLRYISPHPRHAGLRYYLIITKSAVVETIADGSLDSALGGSTKLRSVQIPSD